MSLVIAAVPAWAWATLLMTVFVAVSVATMWFTRYALKEPPRPPGHGHPVRGPSLHMPDPDVREGEPAPEER